MEVRDETQSTVRDRTHAELGDYFRQLRLTAGLTQEQAAQEAGLTSIFISIIENNRQKPSRRSIEKLARAYGVNHEELLERCGYEQSHKRARRGVVSGAANAGRRAALAGNPSVSLSPTDDRHKSESLEDSLVEELDRSRGNAKSVLTEKRLRWAVEAALADEDFAEFSDSIEVSSLDYIAMALLLRIYQHKTRRTLLSERESHALNFFVHGIETPVR